jgi:hypothetical protein
VTAHRPAWHGAVILAVVTAVLGLFAWTCLGDWKLEPIGPRQADYYNLLVSGFRKGSLALDAEVPEALKKAENPWDPRRRPSDVGMHDVSYNRGHYYLYFGVVPAVGLFWPFRAITGHDLPFVYSCIVFAFGAFLAAAWLWLRVVRDHFPGASLATRACGIAAVGLAGGQLVLARRCSIWEMPIAAGHCFLVCMVASAYLALHSRRPWAWLAACGTALGLAVGSRPTLLAGGAGLAVLVATVGWRDFAQRRPGAPRRAAAAALAAGIPFAAIFAGLLAYNQARFGNPLEFGLNYQLTGNYERAAHHFRIAFIPFNFSVYFLCPPQWGRYFPFLHPIAAPARASGYYGIEFVYGALVVCPVLWWIACLPGAARPRGPRAGLAPFTCLLAALALATTGLLLCFNTAAARYTVDFMPWWVWLGAIGWASLERRLEFRGRLVRGTLRIGFAATACASCVLAFLASVELHGLLQHWNPAGYRKVARVFDAPVALADRLLGTRAGPIEMDVTFAPQPLESYEPLVVTGVEYQKDYVFVFYQSATVVRIGYMSDGDTEATGPDLKIVPGRKYRFRIECGSLYPPEGVLYFQGWKVRDANSLKSWIRVVVDGKPVLTTRKRWNEATPSSVQVGEDRSGRAYGRRFAGTISAVRRGDFPPSEGSLESAADMRMELALPDDGLKGNQPIVSAGVPGSADIVGLRMPDLRHFVMLYESWGAGIWEGPLLALPANRVVAMRLRFGPLLKLDDSSPIAVMRRSLVVWMDGSPVWWIRTRYSLKPGPPLSLLSNDVGSSEMVPIFLGRLESVVADNTPPPWRSGPFTALEMTLGGRGAGTEPLVATGGGERSDALDVEWFPGESARIVYRHAGDPEQASEPFAWTSDGVHRLRVEMPSFGSLDSHRHSMGGHGRLRIVMDGAVRWDSDVAFYDSASESVSVGRNAAGEPGTGRDLGCAIIDLRQVIP